MSSRIITSALGVAGIVIFSGLGIFMSRHLQYGDGRPIDSYRYPHSTIKLNYWPGINRYSSEVFDDIYDNEVKLSFEENRPPRFAHMLLGGKGNMEDVLRAQLINYLEKLVLSDWVPPELWFATTRLDIDDWIKCSLESVLTKFQEYSIILTIRAPINSTDGVTTMISKSSPYVAYILTTYISIGRLAIDIIHSDRLLWDDLTSKDHRWGVVMSTYLLMWEHVDSSSLADIYRILVLYYQGGLYTDVDMIWHQSFSKYWDVMEVAEGGMSKTEFYRMNIFTSEWTQFRGLLNGLGYNNGPICTRMNDVKPKVNNNFIVSHRYSNIDLPTIDMDDCVYGRVKSEVASDVTGALPEYVDWSRRVLWSMKLQAEAHKLGIYNLDIPDDVDTGKYEVVAYRYFGPLYTTWVYEHMSNRTIILSDIELGFSDYMHPEKLLDTTFLQEHASQFESRFAVHMARKCRKYVRDKYDSISDIPSATMLGKALQEDCPMALSQDVDVMI